MAEFRPRAKTAGSAGRVHAAVYRRSLELLPNLAVAWWSLANLKTFRFSAADVETMRSQLARTEGSIDDRLHLEIRAWQGLRGRPRNSRLRSGTTTKPTACAARRFTTVPRRHEPGGALAGVVYAGVFSRARGRGLPGTRPGVHRGHCRERAQPWWNRSCRAFVVEGRWSSMT